MYPEHEWHNWRFNEPVPQEYWQKSGNLTKFFTWIAGKIGYNSMDDWYNITLEDICNYQHGKDLMYHYFSGSPFVALQLAYPDHNWLPWKFRKTPKRFWAKRENHLSFFCWLGKELGYQSMDDWYNVTHDDIHRHGGFHLLQHYDDCLLTALQSVYPEHKWIPWKFGQTPKGYWGQHPNQFRYIKWLGEQLGYQAVDDWYKVTQEDIYSYGGGGLLVDYYNNSPSKLLESMYPDHNWIPWKFGQTPKQFWKHLLEDPAEKRKLLNWLSERLGVRELSDWYRVSLTQIRHYANDFG